MIKFFRKIRQELITENRVSKYLLYAIGEIILVVFGILIALQINNWNENRKLRAVEVKYLKSIQFDLNTELKNNDKMLTYRFQKSKDASALLNYPKPTSFNDFIAYENTTNNVFFWDSFVATNNTYKELLSSGNLNLISNDSLKYYLLELDKLYVEIAHSEAHMRKEYEEYLYNTTNINTDFGSLMDFEGIAITGELNPIDEAKAGDELIQNMTNDFEWINNNKTLRNGLRLSAMNNLLLTKSHKELKDLLMKMNRIIDADLANN